MLNVQQSAKLKYGELKQTLDPWSRGSNNNIRTDFLLCCGRMSCFKPLAKVTNRKREGNRTIFRIGKNENSSAAKIIVEVVDEVERGIRLHLHDRGDAVVVDFKRGQVIMDQGPGDLRLQRTSFSFHNVLRCEAIPVSLGDSCVEAPVDASKLGSQKPISIQLLFEDGSPSFDLGTTASLLVVPQLREIEHSQVGARTTAWNSASEVSTGYVPSAIGS